MSALFLTAAGAGLAVAAPVGPMSLLCMRRTLAQGWRTGFATGAGIASGDAVFALVAGLGLAGVQRFMVEHERGLHGVAGVFLLYLGIKTVWTAGRGAERGSSRAASWRVAYGSSVLLTLTNPPTIVLFAALFAVLAPRAGFTPGTALLTVAGVFAGSLGWWLGLTTAVAGLRDVLGVGVRAWVDRVSGVALAVFGLAEIRRALSG
jgi:threonine/homoserine/homoserine lactone efflux protein